MKQQADHNRDSLSQGNRIFSKTADEGEVLEHDLRGVGQADGQREREERGKQEQARQPFDAQVNGALYRNTRVAKEESKLPRVVELPKKSRGYYRAIYPGSFDPVTNGHLDLIERALGIFRELIVAVATNREKSPLFSTHERLQLLQSSLGNRPGLYIESLDGLLVECAAKREAFVVIRGLRAVSDFEGEFQMALTNRRLEPRIETIFLPPREDCIFLSSRIVKEVALLGGNVSDFVPEVVAEALKKKYFRK